MCARINVADEFMYYLKYVKNLRFDETPDYQHLRKMFYQLYQSKKFKVKKVQSDWDKLRKSNTEYPSGNSKKKRPGDTLGEEAGEEEKKPALKRHSSHKKGYVEKPLTQIEENRGSIVQS